MTRRPNIQEQRIIQQLIASDEVGCFKTEFPVAYLAECQKHGWVREHSMGFVFVTDAGREVMSHG